jgi:hypothetical protein
MVEWNRGMEYWNDLLSLKSDVWGNLSAYLATQTKSTSEVGEQDELKKRTKRKLTSRVGYMSRLAGH